MFYDMEILSEKAGFFIGDVLFNVPKQKFGKSAIIFKLRSVMQNFLRRGYPLKVWLITLVCGPYLGMLLNFLWSPDMFEASMLYGPLFIAFVSIFFSLPAFGIYYIVYVMIIKIIRSEIILKAILCLISCFGVAVTFVIGGVATMLQPSNEDGFLFFNGYIITTLLAGILCKIFIKDTKN